MKLELRPQNDEVESMARRGHTIAYSWSLLGFSSRNMFAKEGRNVHMFVA